MQLASVLVQKPTVDSQPPCHPEFMGSEAAEIWQDIKEAVSATNVKANKALARVESKLTAISTENFPLSQKVDEMEDIVYDIMALSKLQSSSTDFQDKRFETLLQRIHQMQSHIDSLTADMRDMERRMRDMERRNRSRDAEMAALIAEREERKASILMCQGSYTFATLLQKYTFQVCCHPFEFVHQCLQTVLFTHGCVGT